MKETIHLIGEPPWLRNAADWLDKLPRRLDVAENHRTHRTGPWGEIFRHTRQGTKVDQGNRWVSPGQKMVSIC